MQCEKCYNRGLLYNRCPSMGKGVTNPVVGGRMRDEGVTSALVSVWCSVQIANIHSTVTLCMTLFFVIINNHHGTSALECYSAPATKYIYIYIYLYISSSQKPSEVGTLISFTLQMEKLRER